MPGMSRHVLNYNMNMKKFFALLLTVILIFGCSKEEEKFELFSAEAFAFFLENGWELNASCRAKGFTQTEKDGNYLVKLSYTVDLILPDGKTIPGIDEGLVDNNSAIKISDVAINSQIQLDSTYSAGKYKIIFNVADDFTGISSSIPKEFELSKE